MKRALAVAALLIQSIQNSRAVTQLCHGGKTCLPEEYCSSFSERCEKCSEICDPTSHNYNGNDCQRYCAEMSNVDGLYSRIRGMQYQQNVILILLIILLILVIISNGIRCIRWLMKRRSIIAFFKKVSSKKTKPTKVQAIGTISNVMHINETERPPSQIYSMTGMEGSTVLTVTTPVSTRYPAEDSTTPTEYSYDNAALQVTPSSDKPPLPGHM